MRNVRNFENVAHSDLVISVCLDLVSMHIYVIYEGSMINHIDRRINYSEKEKWLPFKKYVILAGLS